MYARTKEQHRCALEYADRLVCRSIEYVDQALILEVAVRALDAGTHACSQPDSSRHTTLFARVAGALAGVCCQVVNGKIGQKFSPSAIHNRRIPPSIFAPY